MSTAVYTMSRTASRDANTASSPLPSIPRRTSAIRATHKHTASMPSVHYPSTSEAGPSMIVQPPTPEDAVPNPVPGSSSSSSDSDSQITMGPARRQSPPRKRCDSNASTSSADTPRPISHRRTAAKTSLHIDLEGLSPKTLASLVPARQPAVSLPPSIHSQLVRKKSGEPLKSSLKVRTPSQHGSLSVLVSSFAATQSEPATPTNSKAVHFDAQLERVKLFIAEQKPSAVSRDGSPTDDDSDFPSFIYGMSDEERARRALVMQVTNMPDQRFRRDDVVLEELSLAGDGSAINGRLRVRNLAFEKRVAIRFTFDAWQTTSEVAGKYLEAVHPGEYDRFTFSIRLADMMARIEEKQLLLAIRYTVGGREIWDNNGGRDYQAKFAKKAAARPTVTRAKSEVPRTRASLSDEELSDLTSKLERMAQDEDSPVPPKDAAGLDAGFSLTSAARLSSRYDFAASAKAPWRPASPAFSPSPSEGVPWPVKRERPRKAVLDAFRTGRGSPRDLDEAALAPRAVREDEDAPFRRGRAPQKGYFDLGLPRTAEGARAPGADGQGARLHSYPPLATPPIDTQEGVLYGRAGPAYPPAWKAALRTERGGSEESTPSFTTGSSSSRSASTSPTGVPGMDGSGPTSPVDHPDYRALISQYCFFTGNGQPQAQPKADTPPSRSHSASSVEDYFTGPTSPGRAAFMDVPVTVTRSNSFDDAMVPRSGASTPSTPRVAAAA